MKLVGVKLLLRVLVVTRVKRLGLRLGPELDNNFCKSQFYIRKFLIHSNETQLRREMSELRLNTKNECNKQSLIFYQRIQIPSKQINEKNSTVPVNKKLFTGTRFLSIKDYHLGLCKVEFLLYFLAE